MVNRIRELCKRKNIKIKQLENVLHFANGSIAKSKPETIQAIRVLALAQYFNVSMEYLMTGKEKSQNPDFSPKEYEIIKMYRAISEDSQEIVFRTLKNTYDVTIEKKDGVISALSKEV